MSAVVSIVMTYYERSRQLRNTLESFRHHRYGNDVEVIIVDDGSRTEPLCVDAGEFDFRIRTITLDPLKKWYMNSCIPFNLGFAECTGDHIIIQNAECLHYANIVDQVRKQLTDENYLSFACYSINAKTLDQICNARSFGDKMAVMSFNDRKATYDGEEGWYNHSRNNPVAYHFCAAVTKRNLRKLGGFDPAFAKGIGFDDNEFVYRVDQNRLRIEIVDHAIVIHQYHYGNAKRSAAANRLINRNEALYYLYTKNGSTNLAYCFSLFLSFSLGWIGKFSAIVRYAARAERLVRKLAKSLTILIFRLSSFAIRTFVEPLFVPEPQTTAIPVIINNRNRVAYLKNLIGWLKKQGMENIFVLDNDSRYPPLIDYYGKLAGAGVHVIALGRNVGPYALWETDIYRQFRSGYYVYTDSDVLPLEDAGSDGIKVLFAALTRHRTLGKVGFGIKIDDIPDSFAQKDIMVGIERKYRRRRIDEKLFDAAVDTTFALYAPFHKGGPEVKSARTDHPYEVRHLPWYVNSRNKSEEEEYYEKHANTFSSMNRSKISFR